LWRLPEYVNAVNNNLGYLKDLNEKARRQPSPPFSVVRFAGELIVGFLFALLVRLAIPEEFVETPLGHKLSTFTFGLQKCVDLPKLKSYIIRF
jgi:hypothetical protein